MNINELFTNAVKKYKTKIAVSDGDRDITYEELARRTTRMAVWMREHGYPLGTRIAGLLRNSIETVELEVLSACFGYVRTHLNIHYEFEILLYAVEWGEIEIVFYQDEFASVVEKLKSRIGRKCLFINVNQGSGDENVYLNICCRGDDGVIDDVEAIKENSWHSIYYTSGSTGKPKGVVLTQGNWIALIRNHLAGPLRSANERDVVLHVAPMTHASGALIMTHLLVGAKQVVVPKFDVEKVWSSLKKYDVTTTFLAPTMIMILIRDENHRGVVLPYLKTVFYGGAAMPVAHIKEAIQRLGYVFVQGYGQWEAPQLITYLDQEDHRNALENKREHLLRSAGRSIVFCEVAIMDESGNIMTDGGEGEIVTAGDHVMLGYLKKEEESNGVMEGKWLRSGDIGYMDAEGFVYITDRKKEVIISGGMNVYPREVEEILAKRSDIAEVAVIGVPDDLWGERVHALIVPKPNADINTEELLAWAAKKMATDKRPRSAELVEDLPKSSYGKILRKQLREKHKSNLESM